MRREDWRCITRRRYTASPFSWRSFTGVAGLLIMDQVSKPFAVSSFGRPLVIADSGWSWLEAAPREAPVFVTAQFDAQGRLFQIYFDLTTSDGCRFDDPMNPSFEDAYIDVIWDPDRGMKVLDREELSDAERAGIVSPAEAERVRKNCGRLTAFLTVHGEELAEECRRLRKTLECSLRRQSPVF